MILGTALDELERRNLNTALITLCAATASVRQRSSKECDKENAHEEEYVKTLTFEIDGDGIALITLDDSAKPMNVVSPEWIEELIESIERVATDPEDQRRGHHLGESGFHGGRGS